VDAKQKESDAMRKRTVVYLALVLFGMMFLFQPVCGAQGMMGGMMGGGYGMMGPAWGRGAWMGPGWLGGQPGYGYPGYGYNSGYGQAAPPSGAPRFAEETKELREKIEKKLGEVESLMGKEKPEKEKILAAHRKLLDLQSQLEQKVLKLRLENPQPAGPMPYGGYGGYPGWAGGPWGSGFGCPCDVWGSYNPAFWGAYPYGPYGGGHPQPWQQLRQPAAAAEKGTQ